MKELMKQYKEIGDMISQLVKEEAKSYLISLRENRPKRDQIAFIKILGLYLLRVDIDCRLIEKYQVDCRENLERDIKNTKDYASVANGGMFDVYSDYTLTLLFHLMEALLLEHLDVVSDRFEPPAEDLKCDYQFFRYDLALPFFEIARLYKSMGYDAMAVSLYVYLWELSVDEEMYKYDLPLAYGIMEKVYDMTGIDEFCTIAKGLESRLEERNHIYMASFYFMYGLKLFSLSRVTEARDKFSKSYHIRSQTEGIEPWLLLCTQQKILMCDLRLSESQLSLVPDFCHVADEIICGRYQYVNQDERDQMLGQTLLELLLIKDIDNNTAKRYIEVYEDLCDRHPDDYFYAIQRRFALNTRGVINIKDGKLLQAEECFMEALDTPDNFQTNIVSDELICSNLLGVYIQGYRVHDIANLLDQYIDFFGEIKEDILRQATLMISFFQSTFSSMDDDMIAIINRLIDSVQETNVYSDVVISFICSAAYYFVTMNMKNLIPFDKCLRIIGKCTSNAPAIQLMIADIHSLFDISRGDYSKLKQQADDCMDLMNRVELSDLLKANEYRSLAIRYFLAKDRQKAVYCGERALQYISDSLKFQLSYVNDMALTQALIGADLDVMFIYGVFAKLRNTEELYNVILTYKMLASFTLKRRNALIAKGYGNSVLYNQIRSLEMQFINHQEIDDEQYLDTRRDLKQKEIQYAKEFEAYDLVEVTTLQNVMNHLPQGGALIEYFIYNEPEKNDHSLDLFVLRNKSIVRKTIKNIHGSCRFSDVVDEYISLLVNIRTFDSRDMQDRKDCLQRVLINILITPISKELEDINVLYIAPDENLVNIPFGLLLSKAGYKNLNPIMLECGRDLCRFSNHSANKGFCAFGDPMFSVSAKDSNHNKDHGKQELAAQLPYSGIEARICAQIMKGIYYTGKEATKYQVLNSEGYKVLHISTHGYYDKEIDFDPMNCIGLIMAGYNDSIYSSQESSEYGNGFLTAKELSEMNLQGTELLVLSSCLSGINTHMMGRGYHGLISAASAAGVKYVITHLWHADDLSAAVFMNLFYHAYKSGHAPNDALAYAKSSLQKITLGDLRKSGWVIPSSTCTNKAMAEELKQYDGVSDIVHPFKRELFWGGFVCYNCN